MCVCAWCIMSVSVSLCLSLWGPLMNRHALPIEVKVMAVISTRHGHHSVLWWEATSVYHCCQLHYLPVEPYLSLYTHVEHIWRCAMNLVYQPWLLLDCNQMLLDVHFLFRRLRNNHLFVACQNATIVGNCKWHYLEIMRNINPPIKYSKHIAHWDKTIPHGGALGFTLNFYTLTHLTCELLWFLIHNLFHASLEKFVKTILVKLDSKSTYLHFMELLTISTSLNMREYYHPAPSFLCGN